ncbi:probable polygalacturonase [Nymphaea colorata]|nr:probable polygalacturonase [Nymphaea colorata]
MKRLILLVLLVLNHGVNGSEGRAESGHSDLAQKSDGFQCEDNRVLRPRPHSVSISDFGAVGDGVTLNTLAFQNAIFYLKSFADKGGAQLYVPAGKWLTGSFNLTSHLTLFLNKNAIILGSEEESHWPVLDPLPTYGRGLDVAGRRHSSLINGYKLTDVVITGDNGTIDGQGAVWWKSFRSHSLNYSRPHLVELVSCDDVVVSNLTFINSPAWSIHPVYCSNVQVHNVTLHAPPDSPYTDGIVPDSCMNMCIEDSVINVGHDAIVLKSGWDEYGISYGKPTSEIHIRRVLLQSSLASAFALGSEMSGGIDHIRLEKAQIHDSHTGIKIKTTQGRGGYIKDIFISDILMDNVETAFEFTGHCGTHPDEHYDPSAFPIVGQITVMDVVGTKIGSAGKFDGLQQAPFTSICLSNIHLDIISGISVPWSCSNVTGFSDCVFPEPCPALQNKLSNSSLCYSLPSIYGYSYSS